MAISPDFFGLAEPPFGTTPDPRFLYLTPGHREALAQLIYGVQEHKGFVVLTGEVGTGKTTLLHALLDQLDSRTAAAFVANPMLQFDGILEYMLEDLGVSKGGDSTAQRLIALQRFLTERHRAGQNTVLIVDEAQDLEPQTLERIRLLSNFETTTEKVLQIVLVGQPELRARLALPELRQLDQRIGLRCHLTPLTPDEVGKYIRARLRVAGSRQLGLFPQAVMGRIGEYSGGIPRLINTVCDHCLMVAYADQVRRIDRGIVEQAIRYLESGKPPRGGRLWPGGRSHPTSRRLAFATGAASVAAVAGALMSLAPDAVARAMSLLHSLARAARALLPL